jgi:hypothetical protein
MRNGIGLTARIALIYWCGIRYQLLLFGVLTAVLVAHQGLRHVTAINELTARWTAMRIQISTLRRHGRNGCSYWRNVSCTDAAGKRVDYLLKR